MHTDPDPKPAAVPPPSYQQPWVLGPPLRDDLRLILRAGFTADDLRLMLRAAVLSRAEETPCAHRDPATPPDRFVPAERLRYGGDYPTAQAGPLPVARTHLQCPLMERAERGDAQVPCTEAQRHVPPRAAARPLESLASAEAAQALAAIRRAPAEAEVRPCRAWHQLLNVWDWGHLWDLWWRQPKPAQLVGELLAAVPEVPPEPDADGALDAGRPDTEVDRLRARAARVRALTTAAARDQLRWLMATGRLTALELAILFAMNVAVTDPGWLPCRDDDRRYRRLPLPAKYYEMTVSLLRTESVRNYPCLLQMRASENDVSTPCCEAQDELDLDRPPAEPARELPRSWVADEERPGGPADPVRALGLRPCHLLGQVLADALYPLAERLCAESAGPAPR